MSAMVSVMFMFVEAAVQAAARLIAWIWRRTRSRRLRQSMERRYMQSVIQRYQQWSHVYVETRGTREGPSGMLPEDITVHPAMYALLEPDESVVSGGPSAGEQQDSRVRVGLSRIVDQSQQFGLLGEPGSGKTSHLQWLALKHARLGVYSLEGECILPVLIDLGGYSGPMGAVDFVKGCLRDEHGLAGTYVAENLVGYLEAGRLLFLLDGLNQIPADRYRQRVDRLRAFADANSRNKFVFTCRVLDYEHRFGWPRVLIAPLDDEEIRVFIGNYLPETGDRLLDQLSAGHGALLDLARNPFMLRIMILVHQQRGALPAARGRLLNEFVTYLLARERGDSWRHTAEAEAFLGGLAQLAFVMIERGEVGTTVHRDWIANALASASSQRDGGPTFAVAELIKLGADANLLEVNRRQDRISYYHELLQEYCAARLLEKRYDGGEDLLPLFRDCWWEQTAAMLCGLVDGPDALVLSILQGLGSERGALLAGACCAEAIAVLRHDTVGQVVGSLCALERSRIGPLGIKAMDLIARIDYARIEDMVLEPLPDAPEPRDLQTVLLLGAKYTHIVPIYMGPFYWATRDRAWEPRAYAASLVRTLGSARIGETLLGLLNSPAQAPGLEVMISAVLADMRYSEAADAFVRIFAEGSHTARIHAARGLGRIVASEAEALLTKSLLDPAESPGIREACAFALATIGGVEFVESLAHGTSDTELQEIAYRVLSELQPPTRQFGSSWLDDAQLQVAALRELQPADLLRRLIAAYEQWGAQSYPLAAALAGQADESFIPQLEAAMQALQRPIDYYPHGEYKLREALWWTIDAIRERQRRRGRAPRLSPSPRDWSAFGAPPR